MENGPNLGGERHCCNSPHSGINSPFFLSSSVLAIFNKNLNFLQLLKQQMNRKRREVSISYNDKDEAILFKFPNLADLGEMEAGKVRPITSKVHKIGGLAWQVRIRKMLKPTRLNLYIHCNEAVKDRLWLCRVRFRIQDWMDGGNKPFYTCSSHFYHGFNSHFWQFRIDDSQSGYLLTRSSVEIKLEIKLCKMPEKSFPPLDTSLVVNMGESRSETLLVSKDAMATLSTYFRSLFFGDWRDKRKQDGNYFELYEPEDFDIRAFKLMIYAAMTMDSCEMLEEANFLNYDLAIEIVKQSDKYDFPMLHDCCEQFLLSNYEHIRARPHSDMELLELTEQFNLAKLKAHCLKGISPWGVIDMQIFSRLSKGTQEQLRRRWNEEKPDSYQYLFSSPLMRLLEVADQLDLIKLKQNCLNTIMTEYHHYMDLITRNQEIYHRLSEATQEELKKKLAAGRAKLMMRCQKVSGNRSFSELDY